MSFISNTGCLARSIDEESQVDQPGSAASSARVKRDLSQGQQSSQYQASSPLRQGWAFPGQQASPQDERASQMGISPAGAEVRMHATQDSAAHAYPDRHRSNSNLASSMMRTVVASGNDALNILFEAATAHNQEETPSTDTSPPLEGGSRSGTSNAKERNTPRTFENLATFESVSRAIGPGDISEATQETLNVWDACRFVKMGWFTAREAVTFIDL